MAGYNFAKTAGSPSEAWEKCVRPAWLLWYVRTAIRPSKTICSTLAVQFAEEVLHIFEKAFPGECRPRYALAVAKRSVDLEGYLPCAEAARQCQDIVSELRERAYSDYMAAKHGDKKAANLYVAKHRATAAGTAAV